MSLPIALGGISMEVWPWQSIAAGVLVFLVCLGWHCCTGYFSIFGTFCVVNDCEKPGHVEDENLALVKAEATQDAEEEAKDASLGRLLRREMRLMLALPFLALLATPWTTCSGGMPTWAYLMYLPFLARSKVIEFRLLQRLEVNIMDPMVMFEFSMGALEHLDWFTDGAAPIQAAQCEPGATDMWVKAFEVSWAWPLAALVASLRFWGVMLLAFTTAALAQQALGSSGETSLTNHSMAADTAALGSVAAHLAKLQQEDHRAPISARALITSVSKVLLENLVQLYLQATLYAVIFDRLSSAGHFKLLLSMGLGLAAASKKLLELAVAANPCAAIFWMPGLATVAWIVAKLVFAHTCETHMWNLSTGCVA